MLLRFTGRLLCILFVFFPISISKVIEAHVKVINANYHNDITNQTTDCLPFALKLGYYHSCAANDILSPGNRFEYDYGSKCEFNTSTPTIFTRGFEKTDAFIVLVVEMDETLKTKKFTSCGLPPDNSQGENGNSTIVHTKSYFTGHLVYSFDIEIETVCDPSFCFGLRCDKCVTDHTTTLYSKTDTSIPFSDSTIYIGPDETTAPLSINITSGHITATSPIITTVNQSVLEAGSDEIIAMISSVVGFVFLVGILLSIAYKYKSKNQLRNEQTIQATEQPPPSIWLHSPAVNDQECLENRTQFNVSNNKIDQAKLTQEGALLEEHQQYEKKKPSLENESKQGDNQIFLTDHDKKKRKKHKKQKSDTKKEKLKKRGKKLKDKNSSEHSSFKIDMDEKQTSPHLNGRSAIENTSSVNKETQDKSSAYGIEQQNNKGYPDINDVKDKSHIPATTLFTCTYNL